MNIFGLLYSGARCDAKARGQLCAFAEHRAQREKFEIMANFGPSRCTGKRVVGMVRVLVGLMG